MRKEIFLTGDGSHTLSVPELNVTYHSVYGAISESKHVYIQAGLKTLLKSFTARPVYIFEMGFGTGLNALLTRIEMENFPGPVYYTGIDLYPLTPGEVAALNYCRQLDRTDQQPFFLQLHTSEWEKEVTLAPGFILKKIKTSPADLPGLKPVDLIYYDAFAPAAQPELWTKDIFEKLLPILSPGGMLVTYCSKGVVKRNLLAAGWEVEKLPGPKGKREMMRCRAGKKETK